MDSPVATFPIAIGPKKVSHDRVEKIIAEDMHSMKCKPVSGFIGRCVGRGIEKITFSAEMFVSLADQPERRSGNSLLAGNSNSHRRWRYAGNTQKILSTIPACKDCLSSMQMYNAEFNAMEENGWRQQNCTNCSNWMLFLENDLMKYQPDLP